MSNNKYTVRLGHAGGGGSFGEADTFERAHLIAWGHWRLSFGHDGPHLADVVGPEGEDFGPLKDAAIVAPPASKLVDQSQRVDIDYDDHLTMNNQGFFDEGKAALHDIGVCLTRPYKSQHIDFDHIPLAEQSNRSLHATRAAIVDFMAELADLDHTIAKKLLQRQKAARAAE